MSKTEKNNVMVELFVPPESERDLSVVDWIFEECGLDGWVEKGYESAILRMEAPDRFQVDEVCRYDSVFRAGAEVPAFLMRVSDDRGNFCLTDGVYSIRKPEGVAPSDEEIQRVGGLVVAGVFLQDNWGRWVSRFVFSALGPDATEVVLCKSLVGMEYGDVLEASERFRVVFREVVWDPREEVRCI